MNNVKLVLAVLDNAFENKTNLTSNLNNLRELIKGTFIGENHNSAVTSYESVSFNDFSLIREGMHFDKVFYAFILKTDDTTVSEIENFTKRLQEFNVLDFNYFITVIPTNKFKSCDNYFKVLTKKVNSYLNSKLESANVNTNCNCVRIYNILSAFNSVLRFKNNVFGNFGNDGDLIRAKNNSIKNYKNSSKNGTTVWSQYSIYNYSIENYGGYAYEHPKTSNYSVYTYGYNAVSYYYSNYSYSSASYDYNSYANNSTYGSYYSYVSNFASSYVSSSYDSPSDYNSYSSYVPSSNEENTANNDKKIIEELPVNVKVPNVNNVKFSALSPKTISSGESAIIDVVMYEIPFRDFVDRAIANRDEEVKETESGFLDVEQNTKVKITLTSKDIDYFDEFEQVWRGKYLDFQFDFDVPIDAKPKLLFTANVYFNNVIVTRLKFTATIGEKQAIKGTDRFDVMNAFISYASKDRTTVTSIVQGIKKVRPDLNLFFDVESLRSGEKWEEQLNKKLDVSDLLYLCWSSSAKESKWVDYEWRYTYDKKGIDCIEPIPIEDPSNCPPPEELKEKHFNDLLIYLRK